MATIKKCTKCKRLGGYAKSSESEKCFRCEKLEKKKDK